MNKKSVRTKIAMVIYRGKSRNLTLRADMANQTIWANLDQIASLFGVQKSAISKHIKNIFLTRELSEKATVSKMETVQIEGKRSVRRSMEYYNLDVVIAVGYRVNSRQATQFRVWATKLVRDYLMKGYVLEAKRLQASNHTTVRELQKALGFIQQTVQRRVLDQSEVDSLLSVIRDYAGSFALLNEYDSGNVSVAKGTAKGRRQFSYAFVRPAIDELKTALLKSGDASELFGSERDGSFSGILQTIYQTFDGKELYQSLQEKAAHLLYFVIKDHPFTDGNKRVGAFLFVLFLQENKLLYRKTGEKKINDNALTALALLVAQSDPVEKEQMVALITQLIG